MKSNKTHSFIISLIGFALCISLPVTVSADSVNSYIDKVKDKNLQLSSQDLLTTAAHERSKGLNLKAPFVGVSQMRNLEGVSYAFEISQEIPLSSRLNQDQKAREGKFELQKKESIYVSQEILLGARLAFINYWMSYKKLQLIEELRDWLKHHAHYAQSLVRSSTDLKIYALEIESAVGIYENEASTLKSNLEVEKAKLKELAYDAAYDPGEPSIDNPLAFSEARSDSKISSINFSKLKIANSELEVAKSSYAPNLFVKLRKLDRQMIGMPNQEIMLGVDLPFAYFWQPRAGNAEARASKYIAEANYRKSEVEAEALKESLKKRSEIIKNQLETLKTVSLPAAEKRLQYLKNISPRNIDGLESHHKIFHDYIELKTQLVEIRMKYEELYANWTLLFSEGKKNEI